MNDRNLVGSASLRAVVALASFLLPVSAAAQAFDFEWDAPAQCPTAGFVEGEVTRVVGRPWHDLAAQWRRATASVAAETGGFRLRMSLVSRGGAASERNILAASCTEATEAAVAILTAGMAPGEARFGRGPAGASAVAPREASAGALADETNAAPSSSGTMGVRIRPVLGASLGLDFGTLAAVAPFAQLTAGVELDRFVVLGSLGATGRVLGELDGAAAGAQMFLVMGGLSGCYRITQGNPVVSGCGGVEIGSLEASGFGAAEGRDGRAFWSASLAQGVLDWYITDASVASLGVTGVFPFRRLDVLLRPEEVHRTPVVAARPWLGLGLRFR